MFIQYYGMREHPFGVTPNPHYLYLSPTHREALASLVYNIEACRGFMALIAKPGMGKTTLLFELLERLGDSARTVFLFHTQCNSREFFHYLLCDMGIDSKGHDLAQMHDQLNQVLVAEARAGRRFVLIVDEAQNLADSVLETVRLLSDFETPRAKLMQIILAGQPKLAEKLALPSLAQLRQRISLFAGLEPFSHEETRAYVDHRLKVAGYAGPALFTPEAMEIIAAHGKGIPRDINNICFNALSLGFALQKKKIDSAIVHEVLDDLDLSPLIEEPSVVSKAPAEQQGRRAEGIGVVTGQDPAPIHRDVQPAGQAVRKVAQLVERGVENGSAYRSKRSADDGRPALRVAVLATTVFLAACVLVFLLERAKVDEHLPLPQTVSASNSTVPREGRTADGSSSESGEPASEKRPAPNTATVPDPLPVVQKVTPRGSKSAGERSTAEAGLGTAVPALPPVPKTRKVVKDPLRGNTVRRQQLQNAATAHKAVVERLQVRTVPPEVPVIQPELSSSLQLQNESVSGPDSAEGTATVAAPASVKRVRVGSQAQAAKLAFQPKPEYPALARTSRVQGTVRLEVVVANDGTVEKLRVLSGHPLLVEAAEAAVERWRYQPTVLNGSPIEVVTEVDVDFTF